MSHNAMMTDRETADKKGWKPDHYIMLNAMNAASIIIYQRALEQKNVTTLMLASNASSSIPYS